MISTERLTFTHFLILFETVYPVVWAWPGVWLLIFISTLPPRSRVIAGLFLSLCFTLTSCKMKTIKLPTHRAAVMVTQVNKCKEPARVCGTQSLIHLSCYLSLLLATHRGDNMVLSDSQHCGEHRCMCKYFETWSMERWPFQWKPIFQKKPVLQVLDILLWFWSLLF